MEKYGERRIQIVEVLRKHHETLSELIKNIPEKEVIKPIPKVKIPDSPSMCFIDGGEGFRELSGAGFYMVRATGLVMTENMGEKFLRDLDLGLISYDDNTKDRVELLREAMELEVAIKSIKEYKPDYVFLDGSLYVKASRKPIECEEYSVYVRNFQRLITLVQKEGVRLVGVSEDSKSRLLKQYLNQKYSVTFPDFFTDPTILNIISEKDKYSTVKLTPKKGGVGYTTAYLKVHKLANPLRIDSLDGEQELDKTLSLIEKLSKGSKHYGYPVPLFLAHLDAKINAKHTEWSSKRLSHYALREFPELAQAILGKTRRDDRPKGC